MRLRRVPRLRGAGLRREALPLLLHRRPRVRREGGALVVTSLECKFGPLSLPHPVLAASGCFAYGQQFAAFMDLRELAGLSTKGISPLPRPGNPLPRICETAAGMINSIGLENVGADAFLSAKLPFLADLGISVWVNFFGEDFAEYVDC